MNSKTPIRFSDYSDNYQDQVNRSIRFIGKDIDFFTHAKVRKLLEIVRDHWRNPEGLTVLDLGCGVGTTDSLLEGQFKKLVGIDLEESVIKKAREKNPWGVYQLYDGKRIPFEDSSFDLVFTICVLHHVPPDQWSDFSKEMARVLKPGGLSVVFDHNPLNPLTRKAVRDCPFDRDAVLLSRSKVKSLLGMANLEVQSAYILFFPFYSKMSAWVERQLRHLPLGAQYYVIGKKER